MLHKKLSLRDIVCSPLSLCTLIVSRVREIIMPGRVVSAFAILCFSASVQSTPIANAYTQLYVLANGGCTDAPDFDSCSGTIEPTEQTVASLSRTFAGDQADAIANLETQELKARIVDTGPVSTNQAFARIAEGYRFDPLTSAATFDFE